MISCNKICDIARLKKEISLKWVAENGEIISYRVIEANSGDFSGLYTPNSEEEAVVVDLGSTTGMAGSNTPDTPYTTIDIMISKKEVGATAELKGAKLQVLDVDGKVFDAKVAQSGDSSSVSCAF